MHILLLKNMDKESITFIFGIYPVFWGITLELGRIRNVIVQMRTNYLYSQICKVI